MSQWGVWQTQSIFVQIFIQGVPLKLILHHIFNLPPALGLLFESLFTPYAFLVLRPDSSFPHPNYSFIYNHPGGGWEPVRARLEAMLGRSRRSLWKSAKNVKNPLNNHTGQKICSYLFGWTLSWASEPMARQQQYPSRLWWGVFQDMCSCRCMFGRTTASLSGDVASKAFLTLTRHPLEVKPENCSNVTTKRTKMPRGFVFNS